MFDEWDADKNGYIDKNELRGFVSSLNEGIDKTKAESQA